MPRTWFLDDNCTDLKVSHSQILFLKIPQIALDHVTWKCTVEKFACGPSMYSSERQVRSNVNKIADFGVKLHRLEP
jgi:hypothetical protein